MGLFNLFGSKKKTQEVKTISEPTSLRQSLINDYKKNKYDVVPYIPTETVARELDRNTKFFGVLLPHKSYMTYINDQKLLPGHIVMLWWLKEVNRKQVPSYFLYEYGLNYDKELNFLKELGYVNSDNKVTLAGQKVLDKHSGLIRNHKALGVYNGDKIEYEYSDAEVVKGMTKFKSNGDFREDQRLGAGFEKAKDYENALLAYRSSINNAKKNGELPPNPYYRMAVIYRKFNDRNKEIAILKEGIKQTSYPQAKNVHKKLVERLNKLEGK